MQRIFTLSCLGAAVIGLILSLVNLPMFGAPLLVIGVFLATSIFDATNIVDYCTHESDGYVVTLRRRHYIVPLLLLGYVRIPYAVTHLKIVTPSLDGDAITEDAFHEISAAEFKTLRDNQRQQYIEGTVPSEIVSEFCHPQDVRYGRRKLMYILCWVMLFFFATMFTIPEALVMAIATLVVMVVLIVLNRGEYKEAKVKHAAYNRCFPKQ